MKMTREEIDMYEMFRVLGSCLKKRGAKSVIDVLKNADIDSQNKHYEIIKKFIEKSICDEMNINKIDLYSSKSRGKLIMARKLCVLLMKKHLNISDIQIGHIYSRSRALINGICREFESMDVNIKYHSEFINKYNEFDIKIQEFVNLNKSKDNE